jgi:dimethylargininase
VEAVPALRNAIVRTPGSNFAEGLTTVDLGMPDLDTALTQYRRYCDALRECGLQITQLDADVRHPDSTFVEDTAILTERGAILTRPGAVSRAGEVAAIASIVRSLFPVTLQIEPPGTLDGGDICDAEGHFYIGLSHRTNDEGARQLAGHLAALGYRSSTIDVRGMTSILHLKSGISHIGNNTMVVMDELADDARFREYEIIRVAVEESYAANCVRVNDRVLVAAGYPLLAGDMEARGFRCLPLKMSEFQKMDGGLSCLSLRF